jgi:hypothetical protein
MQIYAGFKRITNLDITRQRMRRVILQMLTVLGVGQFLPAIIEDT